MKDGYSVETFKQKVKRYCQTLEMVNDPLLIEKYKFWHNDDKCWPVIPKVIREVRILHMEIYILGNLFFMIVETPLDFNWDTGFGKLETMSHQGEWEKFTGKFQLTEPGATSSEKWKLMERIFSL